MGVLLPALALAGEARLLVPRGTEADRIAPGEVGVTRARAVAFDLAALPGADGVSPLPPAGHTLLLNLFDDVVLRARLVRAERIAKGMTWVGRLEGQPLGDVVLTVYDGILSGSVTWPGGAYRITYDGTGPQVEQLDHSQFPEGKCFEEPDPRSMADVPAQPVAQADSGSVDRRAGRLHANTRAAAGGTSAMVATVNQAIAETNTGYANSGVVQRVRLKAAVEIGFTETTTDITGDLSDDHGNDSSVAAMRNTYAADEVVLIGEGYASGSGACGIAWLMSGNNPSFAPNAYAVVDRTCATGYYSFGHEMGHNMGLNHARTDPVGTGAYSYSFGYKDPGNAFRTVMAYYCPVNCTRILYFSNPNILYGGKPTGVSQASSSSAYNALSLNNTRFTVANWRVADSTVPAAQITLTSPNGGESWLVGSVQTIQWTSAGLSATANLKISYSNGTTTTQIASVSPTQTSYSWTVPGTPGTAWTVSLCSDVGGAIETCEASDTSNAAFSIVDPPRITVSQPNGGESWPAGSIQTIMWNPHALSPSATITVQYTNGTTTTTIASGLPRTTASYNWTVPNDQAANWKVTVCSYVGGGCEVQDQSDAAFSIVAPVTTPAARLDWNGDQKPDLLWHNQATGDLYAWYLTGTVATAASYLNPSRFADTQWQIRGIADFSHDGQNDILWHHQGTGDLYVWFMKGVVASGGGYLSTSRLADTNWQIRGIADFDGDGQQDILWQHQVDGRLYVWFMNGLTVVNGSYLTPSAFTDTQWVIRGVADFDGDGKADILWHHQGNGNLYVWFLGGTNGVVTQRGSFLTPSSFADTQWKIVEVADFNGDGKKDLLWHHQVTGDLYVWFMGGTQGLAVQSGGYLTPSTFADTNWKVVPR